MAELLYTTQIIDKTGDVISEIHSQRYSMGYMDFFFTESDKTIDFVKKEWYYKTNLFMAIKNAKHYLNTFKQRYQNNKNNGLYIDDKNETEIKQTFDFIENKINDLNTLINENPEQELFLFADLSEVLFMYDLERDIPFGENRKKQEKYITDLVNGVFSEQLE